MPEIPQTQDLKKTRKKEGLTAVGITCGIGSMLVGARQAGFRIVGNIEWRKYYGKPDAEGRTTFRENFPKAFFVQSVDQLTPEQVAAATECDLAMGHPECGNFSSLNCSNKDAKADLSDPGDIPLFVDMVAKFRPKFFLMDDLPKSFIGFPMAEYAERLYEYDLFPEWISNYGYGNIQKYRNRFFMFGARRDQCFSFTPGESDHTTTVRDVIKDISGKVGCLPNQDPHEMDTPSGRFINMPKNGDRPTWREFSKYIMSYPEGKNFEYKNAAGETKVRIGSCKIHWDGFSAVLHGGNPILNPKTGLPLTIRERARIQGFPDDFVFYGTKVDAKGRWNHEKNLHMVKQTGKAMPIQFCRYVAQQVAAHLLDKPFKSTGERILKPNLYVDEAKRWYCANVGYSQGSSACDRCWLGGRCPKKTLGPVEEVVLPPKKRPPKQLAEKKRSAPIATAKKGKKKRPVREFLSVKTKILIVQEPAADPPEVSIPIVHVIDKKVPGDYHCRCKYCRRAIGELRQADGDYYTRLERRQYYDPIEKGDGGHIAKTPLHIARWAVQEYTDPGDWVLDPTAGAGTTLVEALVQDRNAAGMELEYQDIIRANVRRFAVGPRQGILGLGDARNVRGFLEKARKKFSLVVNNPPYFGDQSFPGPAREGYGREFRDKETTYFYNKDLPNLAFLKEGPEYWETIAKIYSDCTEYLEDGGRFVVGVKDQMRNKKYDQLHEKLADVLEQVGLAHEGTAFLRHYPGTLHLNTYEKRYGIAPPRYQTILVFRKDQ